MQQVPMHLTESSASSKVPQASYAGFICSYGIEFFCETQRSQDPSNSRKFGSRTRSSKDDFFFSILGCDRNQEIVRNSWSSQGSGLGSVSTLFGLG